MMVFFNSGLGKFESKNGFVTLLLLNTDYQELELEAGLKSSLVPILLVVLRSKIDHSNEFGLLEFHLDPLIMFPGHIASRRRSTSE